MQTSILTRTRDSTILYKQGHKHGRGHAKKNVYVLGQVFGYSYEHSIQKHPIQILLVSSWFLWFPFKYYKSTEGFIWSKLIYLYFPLMNQSLPCFHSCPSWDTSIPTFPWCVLGVLGMSDTDTASSWSLGLHRWNAPRKRTAASNLFRITPFLNQAAQSP